MTNNNFDLKKWQQAYEATPEEIRIAILRYLQYDVSPTKTPSVWIGTLKTAIQKATGFYCPQEICLLFCREVGIPFKADGMVGVSKKDVKEALNNPQLDRLRPALYAQWEAVWPIA